MHVFNVIVICTHGLIILVMQSKQTISATMAEDYYTYTAMSTEEEPESGHRRRRSNNRLSQLSMLCVVCCHLEQQKANSFIPSIQDKQWKHV